MHARVFDRPPLTGAPDATLYLVGDQQDAVLIADPAQLLHENRRRDDISALALHRLDKNRRHFFRSENGFEQLVFDVARAAEREFVRVLWFDTAAIHIRIA